MKVKAGILGLMIAVLSTGTWAGKPLALVTQVQGAVKLGGAMVKVAQRLDAGARLEVPAGGSVTLVYLGDAHKEVLKGQGYLVVGKDDRKGEFTSVSGPGAIAAVPTGNTGQAGVGSVRANYLPELQVSPISEGIRLTWLKPPKDEDRRSKPNLDTGGPPWELEVFPYDAARGGRAAEALYKVSLEARKGDGPEVMVLPAAYPLKPDTAYFFYFRDDLGTFPIGVWQWGIRLSKERAAELANLKEWAEAKPRQAEHLLSYAQVAYEWGDFQAAVNATEEAYQIRRDPATKELLRKLYQLSEDRLSLNRLNTGN